MSCKHEWVTYQPLRGDSYLCCALGGCGITYEKHLEEEADRTRNLPPGDDPYSQLAEDHVRMINETMRRAQLDKPADNHKKGWVPVTYGEYLLPGWSKG